MIKTRPILAVCLSAVLAACSANAGEANGTSQAFEPIDLKAPAGTYALEKTHASLIWSIPHMGLSDYHARFTQLDGAITLDPANPESSAVELTIAPGSVRTDFPLDYKMVHPDSKFANWDEEIALEEGKLAAGDGKAITFVSTAVEQTGPRTAKITGDLTMRGQSKPFTLEATFNGELESHPFFKVAVVGFNAHGVIKPSEYDVNLYGGALGDAVTVSFSGEFVHKPEKATGESEAQ